MGFFHALCVCVCVCACVRVCVCARASMHVRVPACVCACENVNLQLENEKPMVHYNFYRAIKKTLNCMLISELMYIIFFYQVISHTGYLTQPQHVSSDPPPPIIRKERLINYKALVRQLTLIKQNGQSYNHLFFLISHFWNKQKMSQIQTRHALIDWFINRRLILL